MSVSEAKQSMSHQPRYGLLRFARNDGLTKRHGAKSNRQTFAILTADKAAALALTPVSRETEARLDRYVELLRGMAGQDQSRRAIDASDISGPGISPTSLQLLTWPRRRRPGSISAAAAAFPAWCWPARWRKRRAPMSIWSNATPRRRRSCAKRFASLLRRRPCIWLTSGILWIESAAPSIASLRGRWLRYISLSVSRNRW